jgi:hypothetical protein
VSFSCCSFFDFVPTSLWYAHAKGAYANKKNRYYGTFVSAPVKNYTSTEEAIDSIKDVRRILDNLVRIQYILQGKWKLNGKTTKIFDKLTTRIMDNLHFFRCPVRSNFTTISCALLPKPVLKEGIVQIELILS